MKPQGRCLARDARIFFPDDQVQGEIWQHTKGAHCIYAAVKNQQGKYRFFHLSPQWVVTNDDTGTPAYQGMMPRWWDLLRFWWRRVTSRIIRAS